VVKHRGPNGGVKRGNNNGKYSHDTEPLSRKSKSLENLVVLKGIGQKLVSSTTS
jgi:hypothetical protein